MKQQQTVGKTQGQASSSLAGEDRASSVGLTRLNAVQMLRERQAKEEYMNTGRKQSE